VVEHGTTVSVRLPLLDPSARGGPRTSGSELPAMPRTPE
jgi:hypothetical protein